MATNRYNHKHTHCTGEKCEFRDNCIHFLAWIEAVEQGLKNIEVQDRCQDVTKDYVRVRIEKSKEKEE